MNIIKKLKAETLPLHLGRIEKLLEEYGSDGFAVGRSITLADLYLYDVARIAFDLYPQGRKIYSNIVNSRKQVEANPKLSEYLKSRNNGLEWK